MSTNYVDISGSWSCPARAGKILKITQTGAAGRCLLASESWTFEVKERVATISNGITGVVSQDGKVIIWSNGYTYTRATNFIESCHTGRYLFEAAPDGDVSSKREAEGGWIHENNKPVLTADANYYNRAHWKINAVPHVAKVIRQSLINVKSITRADDVPHLWGAVDTAGIAGVPIAFLELTWVDQGWGNRKGHIHGRKDGGAWVGISTDAAEHELTRESFEIPAALLGGKLELGYSVGSGGEHKLFITDAEVEIKSSA